MFVCGRCCVQFYWCRLQCYVTSLDAPFSASWNLFPTLKKSLLFSHETARDIDYLFADDKQLYCAGEANSIDIIRLPG